MELIAKIERLEQEANDFGFRWGNAEQIMAQIRSECSEIEEHLLQHNKGELQEEIGDLMHAAFSLCVFCKLDPKETLEQAVQKFERRLKAVKQLAKNNGFSHLNGHSFDELMHFWDQAKRLVG